MFNLFKIYKMKYKRQAFTLAEVLITLMVIGILAMVTLPALMQGFEKMMLKSQAKHALSVLSQALYQATAEGDTKCHYSYDIAASDWSGCPAFYRDNFMQKLKVVNKCTGTYTMNGCIPSLPETNTSCAGYRASSNKVAYVLADGTIIILPGTDPGFWVDVNGLKPPNKPGQDILGFSIDKKITGEYYFTNNFQYCFGFTIENPIYFKNKTDLFK